jgi:hypothetical protein
MEPIIIEKTQEPYLMTRPPCFKCGKDAITMLVGYWICGECLVKYQDKVNEQNKKLLLEE